MKHILLATIALLWATSAVAHSPLQITIPQDKATVAAAPSEVKLTFKSKIRLTRVTLTHAERDEEDLDLSGFHGFLSEYAIPMASVGAGLHVIEWRGLSDDGHIINGTFSFTVAQ